MAVRNSAIALIAAFPAAPEHSGHRTIALIMIAPNAPLAHGLGEIMGPFGRVRQTRVGRLLHATGAGCGAARAGAGRPPHATLAAKRLAAEGSL